MGEGPFPATKLALKKGGVTLDQMDVIKSNEAFAGLVIAVARSLALDAKKTNPNGGAIAFGHRSVIQALFSPQGDLRVAGRRGLLRARDDVNRGQSGDYRGIRRL
jgi:hypothetical protein